MNFIIYNFDLILFFLVNNIFFKIYFKIFHKYIPYNFRLIIYIYIFIFSLVIIKRISKKYFFKKKYY